jgi:hypothetical protein
MTDRELLQQALDALEGSTEKTLSIRAMKALRERLAHCDRCGKKPGGEGDIHTCTPKPEQEPLMEPEGKCKECLTYNGHQDGCSHATPPAAQPSPVQEPVGEVVEDDFSRQLVGIGKWRLLPNGAKLYTTPPAAQQEPVAIDGNTSDGYHTFNELYEFRKAYNAALFNEWAAGGKCSVHKSWRHHDGELCFGGGWFIVVAVLPDGQISNHYEAKDWDLFAVPETERALFEFDGHTGANVVERLKAYTAPPAAQRQWVGLTDDEISHMWRNSPPASHDFARAIESKLKERNT